MRETKRNGKRLRRWGGVLVFGAAALLRLLAPGRAEALRSLLLDRAGRDAVAACVALAEPEDGWEDDGAISVFREDGPGNGGRSMIALTHPPSPVAGCLLPVASSQAGDGGRSVSAPTTGNGGAAVCWELAP